MRGVCLNWKILAGLAFAGLGVVALAPHLLGLALPLLLTLACPLSMLMMLWTMQGKSGTVEDHGRSARTNLARDEQLATLKAQLSGVQLQHDSIHRQIAQLEATPPTRVTAGSEAVVQPRQ